MPKKGGRVRSGSEVGIDDGILKTCLSHMQSELGLLWYNKVPMEGFSQNSVPCKKSLLVDVKLFAGLWRPQTTVCTVVFHTCTSWKVGAMYPSKTFLGDTE